MDNKIKKITVTALMTAILCVIGPNSIPIGPVPVSLTNLAIFVILYVAGVKVGTISVCLYILMGTIGLPVFSGYAGGLGKLLGPTGGYIIGFIPMALISGLVTDRFWKKPVICIVAMELSSWLLYLMGTLWLSHQTDMDFKAALSAGVIPFIIVDLIKIVIAAFIGPQLKKRIKVYE